MEVFAGSEGFPGWVNSPLKNPSLCRGFAISTALHVAQPTTTSTDPTSPSQLGIHSDGSAGGFEYSTRGVMLAWERGGGKGGREGCCTWSRSHCKWFLKILGHMNHYWFLNGDRWTQIKINQEGFIHISVQNTELHLKLSSDVMKLHQLNNSLHNYNHIKVHIIT